MPNHVAIIMDGNGRWAKERGLPRTEGHEMGEAALFDVIEGAIELGVKNLSAYAFSTENWRRSPEEVRWLMDFNRDVIHRRRDQFVEMGVRVRWVGPAAEAVAQRHQRAGDRRGDVPRQRQDQPVLLRQLRRPGRDRRRRRGARADVAAGRLKPDKITEKMFARYLDEPDMPDVDMVLRSSGEKRLSNFLIWQAAYAEFVTLDTLWPDFDRRHLWYACELFAQRDRRFGGAIPNPVAPPPADRALAGGRRRRRALNRHARTGATMPTGEAGRDRTEPEPVAEDLIEPGAATRHRHPDAVAVFLKGSLPR